ncbi:MAG: nicotinate (nicotinamide) nucleotide adenylyltransferase [Flavobacteriales bacterium]|jgi:nicotinate-nucleotide adenylyltransferase
MHIGCLFGTFDPPHRAHVAIAEHMIKARSLDQVWFVVTPQNPFKQDVIISPDHHRLAMMRLAVLGHEGLVASGFELDLPKPNYTADTLRFMRQRWPDNRFDLIIGSDNLAGFHRWKDPEDILEHHRLLVYPREGLKDHLASTVFHGHPGVHIVADAPLMPISATGIRDDIRAWRPVDDRLSPSVISYIRQHRLYGQ